MEKIYHHHFKLKTSPKKQKQWRLLFTIRMHLWKEGLQHWVAWNIDPTKDIPENFKGGKQGLNSANKTGYTGPCPPTGKHHYHFNVYALDTKLSLSANTTKDELEKAMEGHILAEGNLIGLYESKKEVSGK